MADSGAPNGYLDPSQGNALVYSTLCGFMLIGLWAGYNTHSKREFISGVRTQSAGPLALNWIASNMSSSLLESYPQMALIPGAGLFGLAAYSFATIAPVWTFGLLGPLIRRVCPDGFTLSEYTRRRFGWPVGVFSALVFIGFMFCFMIVELNTYGLIVQTIVPSMSKIIPPLIIAITTTIYTMYGGFKASLWTDNFNAVVVIIFIIIGAVMFSVKLDLDPERVHDQRLLGAHAFGGELWYILTVSIIFAQMFNQGFWQRAFASKTNMGLYLSVALASVPLFAICFLVGMAGPLAYWAHVQELPNESDDGSSALFYALLYMPKWVHGLVLVLTGVLSSSAYDTFQSAQISVIQSDLFLGRLNIWWCRLLLLLLNVPCVVLALIQIDILQVFLIADLAGLAVIPAVFLGLIPGFDVFNGFDVVVGGCGGFLTVFVFGTIYYHGDAIRGGQLIGLPNGLYGIDADASDYSVIGAFLAAPMGDLCFALASCGLRILIGYAYARYTGKPFTMLQKREDYRMDKYVLDKDRPVSFARKLTNPEDGHRLDASNNDEFHSALHSSQPHHSW
ncbi:hypothetical protein MEQU1_002885 [Malassezia equina]|uniref:Urea active transporter 1 n=1 Tax=Malassezia equina TaxID=1381935 RepID=A0AAF0J170_9BASI|nr:hypothetical protein MEQU1_002885 [Malassezia equina]